MHLNIFMLRVYVHHYYDTVYNCNVFNAAEKHLTLCEHFTMKSGLNLFTLPTTAFVC